MFKGFYCFHMLEMVLLVHYFAKQFLIAGNNRFDGFGNPRRIDEVLPGDILGCNIAAPSSAAERQGKWHAVVPVAAVARAGSLPDHDP